MPLTGSNSLDVIGKPWCSPGTAEAETPLCGGGLGIPEPKGPFFPDVRNPVVPRELAPSLPPATHLTQSELDALDRLPEQDIADEELEDEQTEQDQFGEDEAPLTQSDLPGVLVTGQRDDVSQAAFFAVPFSLGLDGAAPSPKPSPRRRAPRRTKPPPKPRRSPPRRRAPPVRIPLPSPRKLLTSVLLRLGRAGALLAGVLFPTSLNEGEQEFLDDYYRFLVPGDPRRDDQPRNSPRLPELAPGIEELTVVRTRLPAPRSEPGPKPNFTSPVLVDLYGPGLFPLPIPGLPAPVRAPQPVPEVRESPRRTVAPSPVDAPLGAPLYDPIPAPLPRPLPTPPRQPAPRPFAPPIASPIAPFSPTLNPSTTPQPQTDPCKECADSRRKKKKKRQPRTECRSGTYRQLARGIIYKPRRKIKCQ